MKRIGTRYQVFNGKAQKTAGGLKRGHLMKNKKGQIVSKRKSLMASQASNLKKFLIRPRSTRKK